ncbi:FAD-dependent oxidoreductase [Bradyrhizobium sp. INPA01-394B]|uniref:FAD-dependent oxidoreductase n=1 Tax=Bradyrhizobium campsiandrae TaxID=1729892 RepID=A0ABR7U645_9BRAD|nr:FAD-dependent oxidoreductase [Bradyrhizobium campsiandrae]MBC9881409.1 FAD-dependent oxidoreductase [Bradyrhizobium campsiandrae]MBC9979050.1 FAD-dependent oxidoreductase [Bradyrhizobium campsiandrae]
MTAPIEIDHLILGGGAAGAAAAATLRLQDPSASIMVLSADDRPPYYRPALSKQFLVGSWPEEKTLLHPAEFYRERRIELVLNAEAVSLDTAARIVWSSQEKSIRYDRLLIATGARPTHLAISGQNKANLSIGTLDGVHHLRGMTECAAIRREIAAGAKQAVVLGGSFLGVEIAMSLLDLGLDVTIIECRDLLLPHLESGRVSDYFRRHAEERGAKLLLSDTVAAIHGAGRINEVVTASGLALPCDLMVVSIGVEPATDFLKATGISLDAGLVVVDDQLRTSAPSVFAAGDVTSFLDPVFASRRHIEHWDSAVKQGRLAAHNMLGHRLRYDEVSYFFCDIGDISFSMLGAPEGTRERIARGSLADKSLALVYLKDDVPRALFSVGRPVEETRSIEGLIRYRVNLREVKERLHDPGFPLDAIPTQTVLVLQGGGALGAFECGVVKALEEEQIFPDIVAGISIGALNGAIIAGNPRHATQALEAFWSEIAVASPAALGEDAARAVASMGVLTFGVPHFFRPRWIPSFSAPMTPPAGWTSFYDVGPMREMIARYVDFSSLKASPVRLLVGAVNVTSGELEVFDSYVDDLTPDHVLASGSLPPGFPWTEIDGKAYWDGGIVSNSPLDIVIDRCGPDGKRVFIVDLFAGQRPLPTNMMEVMARRDEIVYSERVRSDLRLRELVGGYRRLVEGILDLVDPAIGSKIRQRPLYIELMGDGAATSITRFVREGRTGESSSRDYDFSDISIGYNQEQGYALVKDTLARQGPPGDDLSAASRRPLPRGSLPSIGESERLVGPRHHEDREDKKTQMKSKCGVCGRTGFPK